MRRFIQFLILLTTFINSTFSQEEIKSDTLESRPLNVFIISKSKIEKKFIQEIENECKQSSLFAPRDEFETSLQYLTRQNESNKFRDNLIEKYRLRYIQDIKSLRREKDIKDSIKIQRIKDSYQKEPFTFDQVIVYDIENQAFKVQIRGNQYQLKVPLSEAKLLKDNLSKAVLQLDKQLKEDGFSFDYFNFRITHPTTGSVYVLNPKKPLYLDFVNSGTAGKLNRGVPKLSSKMRFMEPSGNNILDGGETAVLELEIKNEGDGTASMVKAILNTNEKNIEAEKEKTLIELFPGQTLPVAFRIKANRAIDTRSCELQIDFFEENGFSPPPITLNFNTQAFRPPKLEYIESTIKDEDGNRIINNAEVIELTALVQNKGQGVANNVSALFKIEDDNIISTLPEQKIQSLGNIGSGESRMVKFSFVVNNKYNGDSNLPIKIVLTEDDGLYGSSNLLGLKFKSINPSSSTISIVGNFDKEREIRAASLISDVDKNIPKTESVFSNRYALVIGNENYSKFQAGLSNESDVEFAINDATVFSEYAKKTLGIPKDNVFLITNATSATMKMQITKLKSIMQVAGANCEIIFFYAGHGFPEEETKEAYLVPVDISGSSVKDGVSLKSLYRDLTEHPAKKITVFLDACFSGGGRTSGLLAARGVKIKPKSEPLNGNIVVFSASSEDQTSLPYKDQQHGMFTYYLLKKLQDTASNLTYKELSDFLIQNVQLNALKINSKTQNPQILVSQAVEDSWQNWNLRQ